MAKKKSIPHEKVFPKQMFEQTILPQQVKIAQTQGQDRSAWVEGFKIIVHRDGTYTVVEG